MEVANWDVVHVPALASTPVIRQGAIKRVKYVVVTLKCGCSMKLTGEKFTGDHYAVITTMKRWIGSGKEIVCRNCERKFDPKRARVEKMAKIEDARDKERVERVLPS